ncbi:Uncharacterised protein [Enterobacter hormaechei]|nr:Uncharacterised protein [Enterobacter hormaechei]
MLVIASGDTNHQTGDVVLFFTEAHAVRILTEHHAGFQHAVFGFHRTVRNRDGFTQVGWGQLFTLQHRLNVFRLNVAAFHQLLTGEANGLFFIGRRAAKEDVFCAQFEQMRVALVEAVLQAGAHLHFVIFMALGRNQTFGQAGVQAAVEEVGQGNVLRLRHLTHGALGQIAVRDHQVNVRRQVVNRAVGHGDVGQTRILHFLTQHARTHCAGTHTGITGHDNFTHVAQVVRDITRRQRRCAFGFGFHVMHTTGCRFDIVVFFHLAGFQQDSGDHEGDGHGRTDRRDVREVGAFRGHRQHRQNRAWRSRRHQTTAQYAQGEHAGHTAKDNGQDQTWVHQHIREVNFVNTAQEVNDRRAASRLFRAAATKEHVRQQNAHTRTRVRFNQEEDGLAEIV